MKFGWIAAIALIASPGWAAKITVQQLKDQLVAAQQAHKSDAEVAAQLKDDELTEELTRSAISGMEPNVPGQLTLEQLYILEVRSAVLPPPGDDLPSTPAPDAAAQKAILDKASEYVKTFVQAPNVTATKTTRRFQEASQTPQPSFGAHSAAVVDSGAAQIRYTASSETPVTLQHGAEENPLANDKTKWGDNGMIAMLGPIPALGTVWDDAQAAGKVTWLRWETVNGHPFAVFSFSVDKKKSHYAVNYCCFPDTSQAGQMAMRGTESAGGAGNYQVNTTWKNYKATEPYHGEFYIQADTGTVVRLITEVDFKSSEPVRVEDQRIDYGAEKVGNKTEFLPVRSVIDTLERPFADLEKGRYTERHTLFTADYKNYQPAGN